MNIISVPGRWFIRLASGAELILWADGYARRGTEYVFGVLVDANDDEQESDSVEILTRTPSNPLRVELCVARIPMTAVASISSEPV